MGYACCPCAAHVTAPYLARYGRAKARGVLLRLSISAVFVLLGMLVWRIKAYGHRRVGRRRPRSVFFRNLQTAVAHAGAGWRFTWLCAPCGPRGAVIAAGLRDVRQLSGNLIWLLMGLDRFRPCPANTFVKLMAEASVFLWCAEEDLCATG